MPYLLLLITLLFISASDLNAQSIHEDVTIRRTEYGVPHILSSTLKGAAFGLAYAEMEDYGDRVILPLIAARGDIALIDGYDALVSDFYNQLGYQRAISTYHLLDQETRDMLEGFAAGVNHYLEVNSDKLTLFQSWRFSGFDVAAVTTRVTTSLNGERFKQRLIRQQAQSDSLRSMEEAGSNAWALAPSRTKSGKAILVRNPHLSWTAGYYEAHLTVPGKLNFYGDFRIGGLFAIIGGFNDRLGWATTNNNPDLEEVYALTADTSKIDHVWLDGVSIPIERKLVRAEYKHGSATAMETREFLFTPIGPVIHRAEGKIYVLKQAGDGEFRRGQQFVRMMRSQNLEEWKEAMRMQAITSSNYTYADADGNIFYVWNAMTPDIQHISGGDTAAIAVTSLSEAWNDFIDFDQLPQLHNPPGGYLHNENDPFHFTNLNEVLPPEKYPAHFPKPRLRQRSQHSLQLIANDDILSLEDVVDLKHSMRMLVADQLKEELISVVYESHPKKEIRKALEHLKAWDNLVAAESRGGILFEKWFVTYARLMKRQELFAVPWSFDHPMSTPSGIGDEKIADEAFEVAVKELIEEHGTWDLAWGDIHRLRLGDLDLPVGGGPGGYGCFRVLWFTDQEDGKKAIRGGDGWQLAIEFTQPPRAYSVLAYGQSPNPDSPHHTDQAQMFADNKMKKVAFTEDEIQNQLLRSYKPGRE